MEIKEQIAALENEIREIEAIILSPSKVTCTHVMCETCLRDLEAEKIMKAELEVKVSEKREIFNKFKQYI